MSRNNDYFQFESVMRKIHHSLTIITYSVHCTVYIYLINIYFQTLITKWYPISLSSDSEKWYNILQFLRQNWYLVVKVLHLHSTHSTRDLFMNIEVPHNLCWKICIIFVLYIQSFENDITFFDFTWMFKILYIWK